MSEDYTFYRLNHACYPAIFSDQLKHDAPDYINTEDVVFT